MKTTDMLVAAATTCNTAAAAVAATATDAKKLEWRIKCLRATCFDF